MWLHDQIKSSPDHTTTPNPAFTPFASVQRTFKATTPLSKRSLRNTQLPRWARARAPFITLYYNVYFNFYYILYYLLFPPRFPPRFLPLFPLLSTTLGLEIEHKLAAAFAG